MLGLREKGLPGDAIRLADETYKELLGCDVEELAILPVPDFVELIRKAGYTSTYLEALAKLSYETASSYQAIGNSEFATNFFGKTLQIYYLLNEKDKTFSFEREMIIAELKQFDTDD